MDKTVEAIWEEMTTTHDLNCSKCGEISTKHNMDALNAAEEWKKEGWKLVYIEEDELDWLYCPKCNKK